MDDKSRTSTSHLERRHLTVLECDLVGSTTLAHKLDPEDLRDLIVSYQDCVVSWINKLDGYFVQFAGDAVWAYFGYPQAHEDDPIRAIQAGLGMVEDVAGINLHGETLSARVGIASGLCMVGNLRESVAKNELHMQDYITALGEPPNLAARLQAQVKPGAVAVSDETHSLVGNTFRFEDLGYHQLKGVSEMSRVWVALSQSDEKSRFRALRPVATSALIGRDSELQTLKELWDEVCKSNGQVVYLTGDPGIGKSRLVSEVAEYIQQLDFSPWWLHCNEYLQGSAFAPIISLLHTIIGATDAQAIESRLGLLLPQHSKFSDESLIILAELLSIKQAPDSGSLQMSPSRRRERLYEILLELVEKSSINHPLLLVVEDIHWVDPSTQTFLHRLILRSANIPVLILITSRSMNEFDKSFIDLFHVNNFHLDQLQREDSFNLLNSLWEETELAVGLAEEIVNQTDGVPLFIEDVVFSLRQINDNNVDENHVRNMEIPATLRDHLMSRIDKLGENRKIAQIGAVAGREFPIRMISSLTALSTDVLNDNIERLIEAGVLLEASQNNEQIYTFKHGLIRDAAYNSLLLSQRRDFHKQIAVWLVTENPGIRRAQPETIAYHYDRANMPDEAIEFWLEAGKKAKSRSNYVEASAHLNTAYDLISTLNPTRKNKRIKLDIKTTQAACEAGVFGISSEGAGKAYDDARILCKELDYPDDIFPVLSGAGSFHFLRGNYEEVRKIAFELLELAQQKSSPTGRVIGHRISGAVDFVNGNFADAIKSLHKSIDIYDEDPEYHRQLALAYAMDHKTSSLCYLALSILVTGNSERALKISHESLAHSKIIDLHSTNYSLCYLAGIHYFRGDPAEMTYERASESLDLSVKEDYASWTGMSRLIKGESNIRLGNTVEGIKEVEQGVYEHSKVMAQSFLPFAQSVLALAYTHIDEFDKAMRILIKAETLSKKTQQYWYLPEIQRLHAETLFNLDKIDAAKEKYASAISNATSIGAHFWLEKTRRSMSEIGLI